MLQSMSRHLLFVGFQCCNICRDIGQSSDERLNMKNIFLENWKRGIFSQYLWKYCFKFHINYFSNNILLYLFLVPTTNLGVKFAKGNSISKLTWNLDINVYPAKIWIFNFIFCLKDTIETITFKFKEVR